VAAAEPPPAVKAKGKRKAKAKAEPVAKPKRISLPRGLDAETLDLDKALALLALPRTLGPHPETGQEISAGLGRFGPYLRMGDIYVSLRGDDDVLSIGLNRAVDLLSRARPAKAKGKTLGTHPKDGKPVVLMAGRYGPYVEHGTLRATLPAGTDAETIDVQQALAVLAEKQSRAAGGKGPAKTGAAAKQAKAAPQRKAAKPAAKPKAVEAAAEGDAAKPVRRKKAAGSA
ncbi:MAG TPA: topoisomerase C-terminal repeat-containing protein, partial [Rhodospirillales bacterium]|nr:topoisomerase C-terminal repeat-containing protein [Rhodospirillales bacterium]